MHGPMNIYIKKYDDTFCCCSCHHYHHCHHHVIWSYGIIVRMFNCTYKTYAILKFETGLYIVSFSILHG
jgi:hypothetical protein